MNKTKAFKAYQIPLEQVSDTNFISEIEKLHQLLLSELKLILADGTIQLNSFTEQEYSTKFKGEFFAKMGDLTNKRYKTWNYNQKAKYFRMLAGQLRQDFKSCLYKQQIAKILENHNWSIEGENSKSIRQQLIELNLYPTQMEINNLLRAKIVPEKPRCEHFPLDFNLGQDKQTIIQNDLTKPIYQIKLDGKWLDLNCIVPTYLQIEVNKLIAEHRFDKFTKPKFIKDEKGNWQVIISICYTTKPKKKSNHTKENNVIMGVDLGIVKPYSGQVIVEQLDERNQKTKAKLLSKELCCSSETSQINEKLARVKSNLDAIYKKINHFNKLLSNFDKCFYQHNEIKNQNYQRIAFFQSIQAKRERLVKEKCFLRQKGKELRKHKAYLATRDLISQLKHFNVNLVKVERLNWVENTGGKWDFSQQQDILENKCKENGMDFKKVSASKTSSQNPFKQKNYYGIKQPNRRVVFKTKSYQLDRDRLAAINIACRGITKEDERLIVDYNKNKQML